MQILLGRTAWHCLNIVIESRLSIPQSHIEERRGTPIWANVQERIVDVMKKTLGIMVFEVTPRFVQYIFMKYV